MEALARANEVRTWLAEQRRLVKGGRIDVWLDLCRSHDGRLKSVTILEFLQWLPGIGKTRARALIREGFSLPSQHSEGRAVSQLDGNTTARLCEAVVERNLTPRALA